MAGVAEGLDCGATDYVIKPFEIRDLLDRLSRALQSNDGRRE